MLRRQIHLDKNIIKYNMWYPTLLHRTLQKSFQMNYFLKPLNRLSFFIRTDRQNSHYTFYRSQNKLRCFMTYSARVPTSKLNLSRFYLRRGVDRLYLSNYQK